VIMCLAGCSWVERQSLPATAEPPYGRNRRGRKPKYDWPAFDVQLHRLLDHHGRPSADDPKWSCQADVERAMAKWCLETWSQEPAESVIRDRVSKILHLTPRGR
jgi:hypothetical protein